MLGQVTRPDRTDAADRQPDRLAVDHPDRFVATCVVAKSEPCAKPVAGTLQRLAELLVGDPASAVRGAVHGVRKNLVRQWDEWADPGR